jgi:hypothetical protein
MSHDVALGLDTAFRKDPTAGVIVRAREGVLWVDDCIEVRPPKGGRLKPSETLLRILDDARAQGCTRAVADIHYIDLLHEIAGDFQIVEAPGGATGKLEVYTAARRELHESRVRIPARFARLIAQLKEVVSKPQPGGGLSISSPRRAGAHGDLVSAFTLAAWNLAATAHVDYSVGRRATEHLNHGGRWGGSPGRGFG